uniref:indole-3-pyruvate monooxygenase n=1 Tax=Aegilops tauschii subsp. strangulata TaxID=200361 RepID=A0A453QK87_AEGTS
MAKSTIARFTAKFLVVASGENSVENIPMIPGLQSFPGEVIHSSSYKSGKSYSGMNVLVVGSGNSGMEIAYDLAAHGANTSIVVRNPLHPTALIFSVGTGQFLIIVTTRRMQFFRVI